MKVKTRVGARGCMVSPLKRKVASRGKMGRKTALTKTTSAYSRKMLKRKVQYK